MYYNIIKEEIKQKKRAIQFAFPSSARKHDINMYKELLDDLNQIKKPNSRIKNLNIYSTSKFLKQIYAETCETNNIKICKEFNSIESNFDYTDKPLEKVILNPNDLLTISHDFFKYYDANYLKLFNSVFTTKNNFIQFNKSNNDSELYGATYVFKNNKNFYIIINKTNTIVDLITFIHELLHAFLYLDFDFNVNFQYEEIPSMTSELFLIEYLKTKKIERELNINLNNVEVYLLSNLFNQIYELNFKNKYLTKIKDNHFSKQCINRVLKNINIFNEKTEVDSLSNYREFIDFFEDLSTNNTNYTVAQIIAYDLFLNNDKEKALKDIDMYLSFCKYYSELDTYKTNEKLKNYIKKLTK